MAATDANADTHRKPPPEAQNEANQRAAALHRDTASASPEHRGDLTARSRPDTGSKFLQPMELADHGAPASDHLHSPDVRKNPGGNTETTTSSEGVCETVKNEYGETTHTKLTRKDGSISEAETGPNGEFTTTERTPDGNFTKNIITGTDVTAVHHQVDGKGGFTETTEKSDGTKKVHDQKANGEFTESNFENGVLKSQNRHAADGSLLPPEAAKPTAEATKPDPQAPTDPVGIAADEVDKIGKDIVDRSKTAGFYRNVARIAGGTMNGVVKVAAHDAPAVLQQVSKICTSSPARAVGGVLSPLLNGLQAAGGVMKEAQGDPEGRHDIAKAVLSWGVGGVVGVAGAETGPFDAALVGGAVLGTGQAYDAIRENKPITYPEAKEKHDSSWFYRLMEPNENNWVN
jgi:hypothetical protein